jgi:type II secretion system (T2SS) protein M
MNGYWQNLRPFEKRVVVGVAALFFVVLNFLFVFPYFSEWGKSQKRMIQAQETLRKFRAELAQTNTIAAKVREMEREGLEVPPEDQGVHFANAINIQAGKSGVNLTSSGHTIAATNQFFIELSRLISAQSPEQPLVDFLYNLGEGNSLIRVRDLNLRTDPQRQQLVASITLVASYQKKASAKPSSPAKPGGAVPLASSAPATPGAQPLTPNKK